MVRKKFILFLETTISSESYVEKFKCSLGQIYFKGGEDLAVVKIIELIGSSPKGWSEATQNAVTEAALTIKNIKSVHVKRCTAKVKDNKIIEYNANVKIAFMVQR